jgi:hypothetical protein
MQCLLQMLDWRGGAQSTAQLRLEPAQVVGLLAAALQDNILMAEPVTAVPAVASAAVTVVWNTGQAPGVTPTLKCSCIPSDAASNIVASTDTCQVELSPSLPFTTSDIAIRVESEAHVDFATVQVWHVTDVQVAVREEGQSAALKRVLPSAVSASSCPASR